MIEEIKNIKSEKSDLRKFGITVGVILLYYRRVFILERQRVVRYIHDHWHYFIYFGIAMPVILKPVYWVWMIFATILGWLMTRVILILLFYVILTPIGLIARLFGKQFLDLKWDKSKGSYWNYRTIKQTRSRNYEEQF